MKLAPMALLALVLVFGCCGFPPNPPYSSVPKDFEATYSHGACHADWGRTNIRVNAAGEGVYESGSGTSLTGEEFGTLEFRKSFRLTEQETLALLNSIEQSGFFFLNSHYDDPAVMDGSCHYISITRDNQTKTVSVSNTGAPEAYNRVAGMLQGIADNKTKAG